METSVRIKMNPKEQTDIILLNFSKMLVRRNITKDSTKLFEKIKTLTPTKNIYSFKENDFDINLFILFQKINGVKKASDLEEFLTKSKGLKFVIVAEATAKTFQQIKDYKGELFLVLELLTDIPANPIVPKHTILTPTEKEELLKVYQEKNLAKIYNNDVMMRHLGANIGDIVRIIRPTINSGESIYYRRVIHHP